MDDWKKAFRSNRVAILKNLANPNSVADYLFSDGILTKEMHDEIDQTPEIEKKTRLILDTLDRRGQRSVKSLYNAFNESGNDYLADLIVDYATIIDKKENFNDPEAWPPEESEQKEMEMKTVLKIKDTKSPLMHDYNKKGVYRLHGEKRGKVFMINNTFSHTKEVERKGSDVDVKNLKDLFNQLHFEVVTQTDLSAQKMYEFLKEERDKIQNWMEIECIVLILMSHGECGYIYGNDPDPKTVKLTDLTELFDSENCPGLDDKPRLVFVQACRTVTNSPKTLDKLTVKFEKQKIQPKADQLDSAPYQDEKLGQIKHPSADFLIVFATPEGTSAFRNETTGSWFINALVWTFKFHAKREELHHLLIRVNRLVAKGKGPVEFGPKLTVSEVKSNLRKKFYFFPGVFGEQPQLLE